MGLILPYWMANITRQGEEKIAMPRRHETNPEIIKLNKIIKRLGELDYTPQAARQLGGFLKSLSGDTPERRERCLQAFRDLSHPQFGEYRSR